MGLGTGPLRLALTLARAYAFSGILSGPDFWDKTYGSLPHILPTWGVSGSQGRKLR